MENEIKNNVEDNGAFLGALKRNNKQIKDDRAQAIGEIAQLKYRRMIEDIEMDINQMKRDQENMLDMSPADTITLKLASDFNPEEYIQKDLGLSVRIRNEEIKLELAKKRYTYLFGGTIV